MSISIIEDKNQPMSALNVILVAEPGERRQRYLEDLGNFDITVDCVEQPRDVFEKCCTKEYSGLLLDFSTMMKFHGSRKQQLEELSAKFPTSRLHVDPTRKRVVALVSGQSVTGDDALRFFVEKCNGFKPSKIRSSKRVDRILSILIFATNELGDEKGVRANTTNISSDGVFITTMHPFSRMDKIWIQIKEFEDPSPIQCEVRWVQPWGVEGRLPGVGASFVETSSAQVKSLEHYVSMYQ